MISLRLTVTHMSGLKQDERETFTALPLTIGRAPGSQIRLAANDTRASTRHAEILLEGRSVILKDLKSTNGTYISGRRIDQVKLANGDVVEFGVGGPKLKFDFIVQETPDLVNQATPLSIATTLQNPKPSLVKSASNPRVVPLALVPNNDIAVASVDKPTPVSNSPVINTPVSTSSMLIEEREFPFRNRFKYVLFSIGFLLLVLAVVLFIKQILIWTIPSALIGLFLIMMGWSFSRINITANSRGIQYQGILRSTMINWDEVVELKAFRSRTRLLTDLVYVVQGRNNSIVFSIEDYQDGLELANLIARRSRLVW